MEAPTQSVKLLVAHTDLIFYTLWTTIELSDTTMNNLKLWQQKALLTCMTSSHSCFWSDSSCYFFLLFIYLFLTKHKFHMICEENEILTGNNISPWVFGLFRLVLIGPVWLEACHLGAS